MTEIRNESQGEQITIGIASDHGGFELKGEVVNHLQNQGYRVNDVGCYEEKSVDYPDFAEKLTEEILEGKIHLGILICGTGLGMAISANKLPGIRAAVCHDCFSAKMARAHNNANVLAMGQRIVGSGLALEIVDSFLSATFEGGRHEQRVYKISKIEEKNFNKGD